MASPQKPLPLTPLTTMLTLVLVALTAGCRALDADKEHDRDRNAGGNGSMYREPVAPRGW
jgi:hypothetical protein